MNHFVLHMIEADPMQLPCGLGLNAFLHAQARETRAMEELPSVEVVPTRLPRGKLLCITRAVSPTEPSVRHCSAQLFRELLLDLSSLHQPRQIVDPIILHPSS
jgi:hypothetical protein